MSMAARSLSGVSECHPLPAKLTSLGRHPFGCTGVRQVATGLTELNRRKGKILVTVCLPLFNVIKAKAVL